MNYKNKIIYWLPRILSLGFVLFLSSFSLDVFTEYKGWETILGFVVHLLPAFVLLAVVILAWKYDLIGAIVFLSFAVFYVISVGFNRPWSWYASISLPAIIVGALFILNWFREKKQ